MWCWGGGDYGLPPGPSHPLHTRACGPPPSRASQSGGCRFPTTSVPPRPRHSRASPSPGVARTRSKPRIVDRGMRENGLARQKHHTRLCRIVPVCGGRLFLAPRNALIRTLSLISLSPHPFNPPFFFWRRRSCLIHSLCVRVEPAGGRRWGRSYGVSCSFPEP